MKRAALVALVLLAGCGPAGADQSGNSGLSALKSLFARLFHGGAVPPIESPRYVVGKPYQAGGVWYYPEERFHYQASGLASVDPADHAALTADGERYDPGAMAAAHQTLQLPAIARLTDLETGRQVVVRINDRGPANPGRLLSVTPKVAELLGFPASGVAQIRVELDAAASMALAEEMGGHLNAQVAAAPRDSVEATDLPPPNGGSPAAPGAPRPVSPAAGVDPLAVGKLAVPLHLPPSVSQGPPDPGRLYIDCGTFSSAEYAYREQAKLVGLSARVERRLVEGQESDIVRVGPLASVLDADQALAKILQAGVTGAVIVIDTP
ncbi:MAG: RlpA-like double-psi beta-barrel domain-containing protein [Acidibrevibacterium sp.]|uniref:septal ring lytic transglycosylase RlpA family protein n=1 Tax=Acidibrevibacterium sp. TaxID=2606776 RepID=UPI003CFBE2B7